MNITRNKYLDVLIKDIFKQQLKECGFIEPVIMRMDLGKGYSYSVEFSYYSEGSNVYIKRID